MAGWAVERARESGERPVVVDLCCGSGAIALSVLDEVPDAAVYAVELDRSAHEWAERNLAVSGIDLRLGDMADAFPELDGTVDVVVCNPPYIRSRPGRPSLPRRATTIRALALWSGEDGLDAIRILESPPRCCAPVAGSVPSTPTCRVSRPRRCSRTAVDGARCATIATWQVVRAT